MSGFSNTPKILKGALVEYGISIPPLIVPFQFNPESISRERSNRFSAPGSALAGVKEDKEGTKGQMKLSEFQCKYDDLMKLRDEQDVDSGGETISFDIRLDATDKLNEGNPIAEQFGIAPQLSTLELMMYPKQERLFEQIASRIVEGYSPTGKEKPPIILFVWGRKRILPVNITSMRITEEEFSTDLNPIRATVAVSLTVIEGKDPAYKYSNVMKEVMSAINLANIKDVANVVVPL